MVKKVIIYLFILPIFTLGIALTMFVYSEQTRSLIINAFNLESILNKKIKSFVSRKINDKNIIIKINSINLLKPNWPNIAKIELNDVEVHTVDQKEKSKINFIELGFSYKDLLTNIFINRNKLEFNYLNFKDLSLNGKLEKDKFTPGPLFKIFSLINQKSFDEQQLLKTLLENKIIIGNVNFSLSDERIPFKKTILKINCVNVYVSKYINESRSVNMSCLQNKRSKFSMKISLFQSFNQFSGNIQNIDPKLIFSNFFQENLKSDADSITGSFNGNFNIITDKNLHLESFNFISKNSNLILVNNDILTSDTELSGKILWNKKDKLLRINNLSIGETITANGAIDFHSKTGFSNFEIKKLSTKLLKTHLTSFESYYNRFINLDFIKKYNENFKGGNFNNINIDLRFSFFKKINVKKITGQSKFNNIRFDYNDKIFKKLLCNISGELKFEVNINNNEIINNQSWIESNVNTSKTFVLLKHNNLKYEFDFAKITTKIYKNNFIISKANFFKNNLKYSLSNVELSEGGYKISKVMLFKNNKLQYIFEDTIINNLKIVKSLLKVKNNIDFSFFLKKNLNIEIIGDVELNFILSGDISRLDLNLKLYSDLTNSAFKINYLNLIKKKNVKSSIKTEIFYQKGKLAFIKDVILKIDASNYETSFVKLNDLFSGKILLKNIKTPKLDLKQILISKKENFLDVHISGKKVNFSYFKNNLQNKINNNKNIRFDITADEIILNPKIYLGGSLKGTIVNSTLDATAFGQIWLNQSSLLDSGKFQIYIDNDMSKLSGYGLVGGAETKIIMKKNKYKFPQISFDTSDGGKLLKALGFTKNIRSGEMKININFLNDGYDYYEGVIKSKNFSLINTPGIINSLSILSFSGIQSVISGEGVYFDKGQANIKVKNDKFTFDKVYLSSQSLGIAAKGKIDLKKRVLDMRGSVAPIKLISQIISVVPAVGKLITGLKKEGLFAGQFKMVGLIENPKVELNTLSFAPGILRDLFADDWLNNNNFFIKDGAN